MKTLLVTGGAGFIGSNFIIYMLKKYNQYKIINYDKLTYAGNLKNLESIEDNKNYIFIKGDICDKEIVSNIFSSYDIDYVINFAAESHVDRSILEPDIFIKTNIIGTTNLLNIAKNNWEINDLIKNKDICEEEFKQGKKFLQVSTDEVYGSLGKTGYFREDTPINPHSPYSASKASADLIVKAYFDTYKMPINISRCSNNYGAFQFPEKLIPLIINNAIKKNKLPIYGDGMNIRDWLYVEDHCEAIDMILHKGKVGEVYNIGGNNEKTNIEIVSLILDYLNKNVDNTITNDLIQYVEDRKGHDKRYAIDASKIKEQLEWNPKIKFEQGIINTINWYLKGYSFV